MKDKKFQNFKLYEENNKEVIELLQMYNQGIYCYDYTEEENDKDTK